VVVVTGGSAGVGRAIVRAFAREGAKIGIIARDRGRLDAAVEEARAMGGEAIGVSADVANAYGLEEAAETIEERLGPIEVWVNNAMTSVFAELADVEPDEYRRVTDVVYHGTVFGTMCALRRMLPRDRGSIVQVGSALAYRGIPLQAAYCGAKHAVLGMFESLRCELLHRGSGVTVTMVQLPAINTPQFSWVRNKMGRPAQPVPPIFEPELAARAVVWATRHRKREVRLGGSSIKAIVGNKVAPRLADWVLARSGYEDQMRPSAEGAEGVGEADNLWHPVPGDFAARGAFGDRTRRRSWQWWAVEHRVALAGAGLLALGLLGWRRAWGPIARRLRRLPRRRHRLMLSPA
jgi:NAD(P)-dependent dehydrogenase (short-subunit alcohol dehydrogenase family)